MGETVPLEVDPGGCGVAWGVGHWAGGTAEQVWVWGTGIHRRWRWMRGRPQDAASSALTRTIHGTGGTTQGTRRTTQGTGGTTRQGSGYGAARGYLGSLPRPHLLPAVYQVPVLVCPGLRMSSTALEQFGAATARAVQHVEAVAQSLSVCRQAFREGLADATLLNDAQSGLYLMDMGGMPFHTRTEVMHRHEGMLSAMVSDDFTHDADGGGCVFLDRDPVWFPLVLHFLRTGTALLPDHGEGRAAVLRKAWYYSLEEQYRLAQPVQERLFAMAGTQSGTPLCLMYNPSQGLWKRIDVDMDAFPIVPSFYAGDGSLFALRKPSGHRAGSVSRFCPSAGGWDRVTTNLPIQCWFSYAYGRGHLYGISGCCAQSINVSTGHWEELPRLFEYRAGATPCVVDGRLFVIGGKPASVEEYVDTEQRWVFVPDMPSPVMYAGAVALGGKLVVVGGRAPLDLEDLSAVLEYDPRDRTWTELPSLLTARCQCAVVVLEGDLLVVGGWFRNEPLLSAERYNRQSQCWEDMAGLPRFW